MKYVCETKTMTTINIVSETSVDASVEAGTLKASTLEASTLKQSKKIDTSHISVSKVSTLETDFYSHSNIDRQLETLWDQRHALAQDDLITAISDLETLSQESSYKLGEAGCKILRSATCFDTKQALSLLQDVKPFIESTSVMLWKFRLYFLLSERFFDIDHYEQSLHYASIQLKLANELQDIRFKAIAALNIGRLHGKLRNTNRALDYFVEATALFSKLENESWGIFITSINKCCLFREIGNLEKATKLAKWCLEQATETNHARSICIAHFELGICSNKANNPELAIEHFEASFKLAQTLNMDDMTLECYIELARFPNLNKLDERAALLEKALELAMKIGHNNILSNCYQTLAEFHKENNNYELAYGFLEKHAALEQESSETKLNNSLFVFEMEKTQQEANMHRLKSIELQQSVEELEKLNKKVKELSIRDVLTGLYNRRHIQERVHNIFNQAIRYNTNFSICLLDIDNFKLINDGFSHQVGDSVLQSFAKILLENIRSTDIVARYGGEEFIILLPETSLDSGHELAERIRSCIEAFDWSSVAEDLGVTASFGLSSLDSAVLERSHPENLISLADKQLYTAKDLGRNRVCSSCPPPPT